MKNFRLFTVSVAALFTAAQASASTIQCSNRSTETRCSGGSCATVIDGFTPAQLSRRGQQVELCIYSGCWDGRVVHHRARDGVEVIIASLQDNRHAAVPASTVAIIFNQRTQSAQATFADFSLTMECIS